MPDERHYNIPGTPLKMMPWSRETGQVKLSFHESTDYATKRDFLRDLHKAVHEAQIALFKSPDYVPRPTNFDNLPQPTMTAEELRELLDKGVYL